MSFHPEWFGRAPVIGTRTQEASDFDIARTLVIDELRIATVDRDGRRIKEKDIRTALKTVEKL